MAPRSAFLLGLCVFASIQLAVHIKNYIQVGHFFMVVKGDAWDSAYTMISLPGEFVSSIVAITLWGVHTYPYYLIVEIIPLVLNALLYGSIAWLLARALNR